MIATIEKTQKRQPLRRTDGRELPVRKIEPVGDAVRSYSAVDGRFVVSCHTRSDRTTRNGWSVTDVATGAVSYEWNFGECIDRIASVVFPPTGAQPRFITLPRPVTVYSPYDCVLYDRVTGRYWVRKSYGVAESIAIMESLVGSLPEQYGRWVGVSYVPVR